MKKLCVPIVFLIIGLTSEAQQMPVDFSDSEEVFTGFDGSSFAVRADPDDSNNDVGEFFNDGSTAAQGFYLDLNRAIDLGFQQRISLDFYSFDPNSHTITLKLEMGTNPDVEVTRSASAQGWTDGIVFDFANATQTSDGSNVNATGAYDRIVIFIDVASATPGTYLIDNIDDGTSESDPHELDVIYDHLVWSDEFDTDGVIDDEKWFHQTQLPPAGNGSWFNGELQHYTDRFENSFVEGGFLNIVAIREDFTDQGETKAFTSARLNSKYSFTYGRVDVRAKLPRGNGTWPAIWTLGKNINEPGAFWHSQGFGTTGWPACGEIDIMEHGLGAVNYVSSAIHTPSSFGNTVNFKSKEISDVADNFHIYSVNWSPDQITFLIDDVGFYTYDPSVKDGNTWPFNLEQYLILNIAMGGIAGDIDGSFTESSMVIDYVRVYQTDPDNPDDPDPNPDPDPLSAADPTNASLELYPNPASDAVTISSKNGAIDRLVLYTLRGEKILSKNTRQSEEVLDISTLSNGIYLLHIYVDGSKLTRKLVVE